MEYILDKILFDKWENINKEKMFLLLILIWKKSNKKKLSLVIFYSTNQKDHVIWAIVITWGSLIILLSIVNLFNNFLFWNS